MSFLRFIFDFVYLKMSKLVYPLVHIIVYGPSSVWFGSATASIYNLAIDAASSLSDRASLITREPVPDQVV